MDVHVLDFGQVIRAGWTRSELPSAIPLRITCRVPAVPYQGLTRSLSLRPGDGNDADAHWEAYQPLWLALLRGEGLPAEEAAELIARRGAWVPVMYDALMRAVCDAVARLELGYTVVRPDAGDAADAAADPVRRGSHVWNAICGKQKQACRDSQRDAAVQTPLRAAAGRT